MSEWFAWAIRLLVPAILAVAWGAYQTLGKVASDVTTLSGKVDTHGKQLDQLDSKLDQHSEKLAVLATKVDAHSQQLAEVQQQVAEVRRHQ